MKENQRIGRPLRTDPEDFPERFPLPTRNLYAELNKLIGEAGLTHKGIAELVASELNQTIKQIVRQLGETHSGPTRELFEAVIATAAGSLGESAPHLLAVYLPLWERAQPDTRGSKPAKPAPKSTAPTAGFQRPIRVKAIKKPNLAEKTARLLNLLVDGKEADAAAQLNYEFGRDTSMLTAALTEVGRLVPETVAALLHAVRELEGESRSTELLVAIGNLDGAVAERIIAVPRHDEPAPSAREPDILQTDPVLLFGRRTASLIRRGDIGQACREVAAKFYVPASGPENSLDAMTGKVTDGPTTKVGVPVGGQENILGAIITSAADGSALVSTLLSALGESHREQMLLCVAEFLRGAQSADADDTLRGITGALSADLRETVLMLSRKSQVPSSPGPVGDVFDAFFAKPENLSGTERLITRPTEPETTTCQSPTSHIPAHQPTPTTLDIAAGPSRTAREPAHQPTPMRHEPPGLPPWLAESETTAEQATSAADPPNAPPWLSAPQPPPQQAPEPPVGKVLLPPLKGSKTSPLRPVGSTSPIVEQGRPGYRNRYTDPEPIVYEDVSPRSYVKRGPRTQTADSLRAPFDFGPAPLVGFHVVEGWVERPRFPRASVDGPSDTPYPTTSEPEKPPTEPVL
ncbi:hypothetical protein [Nocardia fluminea]|uniref:hypothetical protein n=1 Tax=Nocardia fluminea TaxID=134984 RepID=UPI00378EEC1D